MLPSSTILLVEDNPDDEFLALRALAKVNIRSNVVVVRDGAEALDYIYGTGAYEGRDINYQPRVIFLDLKLPKLNGLDVLKNLREDSRTQLLPVVMLTASDEKSDIESAYRLGANSFISKPVDFGEFLRRVGLLGEYWLGINLSPQVRLT